MIRLEKWAMVFDTKSLFFSTEQKGRLIGFVYNHPRFKDGEEIETSHIVELDICKGKARTYSGNKYILGKPDPNWIAWLKKNNFIETLENIKKFESCLMN